MITADSILGDVLLDEPTLIPVINRFGITLGVSDHTVAQACDSHGLDTDFLLLILNTYSSRDYFPERRLNAVQRPTLVKYFTDTYNYYLTLQLPNIERHFQALVRASGPDNNLSIIHRMLELFNVALHRRVSDDTTTLFPAFLGTTPAEAAAVSDPADEPADLLDDFLSMMVKHLTGKYDINLGYAVISAAASLSADLSKNDRLRRLILLKHMA